MLASAALNDQDGGGDEKSPAQQQTGGSPRRVRSAATGAL
jgi:hypothetical protein